MTISRIGAPGRPTDMAPSVPTRRASAPGRAASVPAGRASAPGRAASVPAGRRSAPPFATVLERHGRTLLRFCISQAGPDRGEDVFQETMIAALRAYDTLEDPAAVRSWLFSIAARKAVDSHRAVSRGPLPLAEPEQAAGEMAADPPAAADAELWREVARLPDKQRQAVALRFVADLSHREIGEVMGTSEAAARRNVFEGVRRLREDLTDPAT
jgi:RNA polymerase sigma factor (sigma-70 family)